MLPAPRWLGATAPCVAVVLLLVVVSSASGSAPATPAKARLSWTQLSPSSAPQARKYVQMAYDAHDGYVVLYGGYDPFCGGSGCSTFYYDTWEFLGGNWTQLHPATHPSAPTGMVLAYDPSLNGVLAFGGVSPYGGTYYNQTWLFSGGNWTQLSPAASPPPRAAFSMAYDAADREMVLFGGTNATVPAMRDTWTFNGTTWTRVHSRFNPPASSSGGMVFDALSNWTLMVGEVHGSRWVRGTWAFHAGQWSLLAGNVTPLPASTPKRYLAYVSALGNGTPVLFGGEVPGNPYAKYNATYEFFDGGWHEMRLTGAPPPLANGGLVDDAADGYDLLFGGGQANLASFGESWALR